MMFGESTEKSSVERRDRRVTLGTQHLNEFQTQPWMEPTRLAFVTSSNNLQTVSCLSSCPRFLIAEIVSKRVRVRMEALSPPR
jgi:hypothetical protein